VSAKKIFYSVSVSELSCARTGVGAGGKRWKAGGVVRQGGVFFVGNPRVRVMFSDALSENRAFE
jgi:hypothetical protein